MKLSVYVLALIFMVSSSCKLIHSNKSIPDNTELSKVFYNYYDERLRLCPIEATQNGDNRYNDQFPVDFTDSYQDTMRSFYTAYLSKINDFDREKLNKNDRISFDIFKREM